jgi:Ca2+-binding EF-hand superfamily protein
LLNKLGVQLKDKSDSSISNNEQTASNEKPEEVILPVISDKVNSLMTAFVKKDTSNLGKINSVQVKDSLCEVGIPITQMQCDNMLSRLGFSPEKVVEYQSLILALSNKSTGGLAHAVLSDATQRYYVGSKRASRSTPDAEVNVICSLHKEFLKLVSQLRSHDTKKNGLISKDAFQEVIKEYLPSNSHEILESLTDKVLDKETGLVIYPKFLSFFDGPPVTKQKNDHDDAQNNMDESNMKDFKQLDAELMKLCLNNPEMVIEAFEVIDPNNTCRITKNMLQQILFRLGFDPNMEVVGGLWDKLLKTKDGCIHPHEFIRHYTKPHPHQPEVGRMVMTDNHVPLKSKFLHRDADIIMRNLKGMLSLYQKSIIGYFRYKDPQGTGLISSDIFQKLLVSLCPQLNNQELTHLTEMFKDEAEPNMVNYVTLMKGVTRPQPVYKVGNDLSTLLAHFPAPTVSLPQVHLPVSTPPQYGLPGVKVKLQRKLMQRWNEFKRNLSKLDPLNTGLVSIKDFHAILSDYGVTLSREDSYHILQELDPLLSGSVNYLMFFQLLMGQQQ